MNRNLSRVLLLCACGLLPCLAFATDPYSDLLAEHRHVYQSQVNEDSYRLALSELKKINNSWIIDREEIISAEVFKRTIEISPGYHLAEVEQTVNKYFTAKSGLELYRCSGLDCGSSNAWANNYFKVKQLYGLDPSQSYRVWALEREGKQVIVSCYIVQRGNNRIYVQLETMVTKGESQYIAPDAKFILQVLQEKRFYKLPSSSLSQGFATNETLLKPVARALQIKPTIRVFVVGHDYLGQSLAVQQKNSMAYAEQVVDMLKALGVPERKMQASGLGSLAPHAGERIAAVYLVLNNTRPN